MIRWARKVIILLFSFASISLYSFDKFYYDTSEFFAMFEDPNTGLTIFPTLNIPMGGEYEGMGTAYTAIARDASFFDANPAGSSRVKYSELSFFHNNWIADTSVEGVAYLNRTDEIGYGFGGKFLYVPFTEYDNWGERVATGYYSEIISTANFSYNFLESYSFSGLSVGSNFKLAYRGIPDRIYPGQSAMAVMTDVGVLTRINFAKFYSSRDKNFSVGLVLKNLGIEFVAPTQEPLPTQTSIGVGYSPIRPLLLAFDFNVPISLQPDEYPAESPGFATGLSVQFTDFFAAQTGFLLKGGNPRISLGSIIGLELITFTVNYTLDMTTQLSSLDRFSLEVKLNLGDDGRAEKQAKIDTLYVQALEAFANGNIEQTIDLCQQILNLDSGFDPARDTLSTAQRTLELQEQMDSLQQIEG